jgi:hypothetical protein
LVWWVARVNHGPGMHGGVVVMLVVALAVAALSCS